MFVGNSNRLFLCFLPIENGFTVGIDGTATQKTFYGPLMGTVGEVILEHPLFHIDTVLSSNPHNFHFNHAFVGVNFRGGELCKSQPKSSSL